MIDEAVTQMEPLVGTAPACRALGASRASLYRRRTPPGPAPPRPRPASARALSENERRAVLAELHSERFVDSSPAQVWAVLLDEGVHLASVSTMYRLLRAHGEVRERRAQVGRKPRNRPGPARSWSPPSPTSCGRGTSSATRRCWTVRW